MKKKYTLNSFNIFIVYYGIFIVTYLYNRIFPSNLLVKFLLVNSIIMLILLSYSYIKYIKNIKNTNINTKEHGTYYLLSFVTLITLSMSLI